MLFFMKKVVSRFLFPLPISLEFLLVGLFLLLLTRRQRAGKALVSCGTILLIIFSSGFISQPLLHHLEHRYRPLVVGSMESPPAVSFIAVLGGGANNDPDVPLSSRISPDLLVRLVEGLRLHRVIPGSKLILSGSHDSADGMATMAQALGVSADDILKLSQPTDTAEESQQISRLVGSQRFILVTSAAHMPRAMALFHKRGMQPIAAPTDYITTRHSLSLDDFMPDAVKLGETQAAFYEYLGLVWETLRGQI